MTLDGTGVWDSFSRHRKPLRVFKQGRKRIQCVHLEDSSGSDLPQLSQQHGGSRRELDPRKAWSRWRVDAGGSAAYLGDTINTVREVFKGRR